MPAYGLSGYHFSTDPAVNLDFVSVGGTNKFKFNTSTL